MTDQIDTLLEPGKFDYIYSKHESYKIKLVNAYQAITQTETWNYVKKYQESFMSSKDPEMSLIKNKMVELGYDNNSGSSFDCIMLDMQYIAVYCEENFRDKYLASLYL